MSHDLRRPKRGKKHESTSGAHSSFIENGRETNEKSACDEYVTCEVARGGRGGGALSIHYMSPEGKRADAMQGGAG